MRLAGEVFLVFLKLGLTSFGGPVAHLGYFHTEFVERRRWFGDAAYADLVALCQLLPGPASSQVGMAIGWSRAGWLGALAAWLGFTLPSALLLVAFAGGYARWGAELAPAAHGLVAAAVAVVAVAVVGMGRTLCPDRLRAGIAVGAAITMLAVAGRWATPASVGVLAVGAAFGVRFLHLSAVTPNGNEPVETATASNGIRRRTGLVWLAVFAVLLVGLPTLAGATGSDAIRQVATFYRAGALVFGGGHVVLPWLEAGVVGSGWVPVETFLAGYGAAQAVPGPLFTFAAYLGAVMPSPSGAGLGGIAWAAAMLVAIFLPAALLVFAALPFWDGLRRSPIARRALAGVNAAVVGLLAAALIDPLAVAALRTPADVVLVATAFALLQWGRWPPVGVVGLSAVGGWLLASG